MKWVFNFICGLVFSVVWLLLFSAFDGYIFENFNLRLDLYVFLVVVFNMSFFAVSFFLFFRKMRHGFFVFLLNVQIYSIFSSTWLDLQGDSGFYVFFLKISPVFCAACVILFDGFFFRGK